MVASVYSSLLQKDFKRKKGEIKDLRKEMKELYRVMRQKEDELAALETVIKGREPDFDPESVKAIATRPKLTGIKWNSLTKAILGCLREAEGPVRSDVITDYVIETTGAEINSRADLTVMRRCVRDRLRGMYRKGQVLRHHDQKTGSPGIWSLNPDFSGQK